MMLDYYGSELPFNHTTDEVMKPWYDNYCFAIKRLIYIYMKKKKNYVVPTIQVMVMEPYAALLNSSDTYKVQAKSNEDEEDLGLEFGGNGGGLSFDPD